MKLRSRETYWLLKNGILNAYPSLRRSISCDVVVVGGGITGALIAFQLSSEGYKTTLIDERDVSLGSTSATTSLLQYELDEPLYSMIEKVGERAAVDTYRQGIQSIKKLEQLVKSLNIDCDFATKESLYIARTSRQFKWLRKEFECRKKFELGVSWLTSDELRNGYGVEGSGAILSDTAASMDAYQLAHFLLDYSMKHYGLEIYDHTPMEKVNYEGDHSVLSTGFAKITAKHVVYATGYETQGFLKDKIVDLISTYAFISEPLQEIPSAIRNTLFWDTEDPYLYTRTTSDNRILVGGCDVKFKNAERRDLLIEKKEKDLEKKFATLIPGISLIPDFSWAGTFGVTKDALPYMGKHPDFPNSYFVLGFGGNGITFSVMGMEIISDALKGKHNKFLEYFRFGR